VKHANHSVSHLNRRSFIKKSLAAAGVFSIVPRYVLGGPGYQSPSDELTKAIIGVGGMGQVHIRYTGARLLAVCDVDENHLNRTLAKVSPAVKGYKDFREVLERPIKKVPSLQGKTIVNLFYEN